MTLMMRDLENRELGREEGVDKEQRDRITIMLRKGTPPRQSQIFVTTPSNLFRKSRKACL